MTFAQWYVRNVPAVLPTTVQQRIDALGALPNYPKSWVQSSPRMVPGVLPWALTDKIGALAGLSLFVQQEVDWRGFPGTTPAPVAFHPDGSVWLNDDGDPVPVDQWEGGHLTADQLLVAGDKSTLDPVTRKRAWQQAIWLRDSVLGTVYGCKVGALPWFSGNPRDPGNLLRFIVRQYRALPESALLVACGLVLGSLDQLANQQGATTETPWPFYNPAASKQSDHGNIDLCTWMLLCPLLAGLCELRALTVELQSTSLMPIVDRLIDGCLGHAERAFFEGEKATGLPGRLADDLDHADASKVHIATPKSYGAMTPWGLAGLADADEQHLLGTQLRDKALALYHGCPFFDTGKPGFGADSKLLGLTIRCAGAWGFNT